MTDKTSSQEQAKVVLPPLPEPFQIPTLSAELTFGDYVAIAQTATDYAKDYATHAVAQDRAARAQAEPVSEEMDAEAYAELFRLREAVKGPSGFATWQDAATDERIRRVKAERALAAQGDQPTPAGFWLAPMEPDTDMRVAGYEGRNGGESIIAVYKAMRDSWLARHPVAPQPLAASEAEPRFPFAGFDPKFCPGSNPDNPQEWVDEAEPTASSAPKAEGEAPPTMLNGLTEAERVPLTESEVLTEAVFKGVLSVPTFAKGVRFAERHHGIGSGSATEGQA